MKYLIMACLLTSQAAWGGVYPVAGLTPDRRPEGAPVTSDPASAMQMEGRLLYGINKPVPESIQRWVKDQGGWFNPFSHPGMPGRYDLRGWHGGKGNGS